MSNQWTAPVFNFAGLAIFEGGEFPYVPSGDYKVRIDETDEWKKKGETTASSIIFRMTITEEGPQKGKPVAKWTGLTLNEGNARNWKAAYLSCGAKPESLETAFAPAAAHFLGKEAYVHVESPPQAEGQKIKAEDIDVSFLQPQTYQKRKAARGNGATATGPMAITSPAPALPTAPGTVTGTTAAPQPPPSAPGSALFGQPPTQAPQQQQQQQQQPASTGGGPSFA